MIYLNAVKINSISLTFSNNLFRSQYIKDDLYIEITKDNIGYRLAYLY
jgi:hypothetical protein